MTRFLRNALLLFLAIENVLSLTVSAQTTAAQPECANGLPEPSSLTTAPQYDDFIQAVVNSHEAIQVIVPTINFTCHGRITHVTAVVLFSKLFSALQFRLYLQVWRPNVAAGSGKFELVGSEKISKSGSSLADQVDFDNSSRSGILSVDLATPLHFQPGDVLGLHVPTSIGVRLGFGIALGDAPSSRLLTFSIDTNDSRLVDIPCEAHTCDVSMRELSGRTPLLRVDYETLSLENATETRNATCSEHPLPSGCVVTTIGNTSPATPPLPTDPVPTTMIYIIAGVVPGALLIVIFVVFCVFCIVCNNSSRCLKKRTENTNPTYEAYANPDDLILPGSKHKTKAFITDSPLPNTPIGFENGFEIPNYATTYATNGEHHVYHELVKTPEPPPLPDRGSIRGKSSIRFSVQSMSNFPYSMPNTPAPSCPYLEAVPMGQVPAGRPMTPQESPPSSASSVSDSLTKRKLYHSLDEDGFRVPTAEEREICYEDESKVEDLYSKLRRPFSGSIKKRDSRDNTFFEPSDIYWEPSHSSSVLFNQLARRKYREIKRKNIRILDSLGGGHFSSVHKGVWEVPGGCVEVAIKKLKDNASEKDKVKFLQEAAIMGQFLHPNVVKLHGVVTVGEPVMILLEVMPLGDLKNYIRSLRSKPRPSDLPHMFLRFCREIACGMNYLANKGYVHRDLAARNVLLSEDMTCKIADFGMARDLDMDNIYQSAGGKIPIKWTAPEGLKHRQYSTSSDVWSYGMVLFEIWTLGRKPYEGASTDELMAFMDQCHCQAPPPGTPRDVYRLMVQCWHPVSSKRPRFSEISHYLNSTDDILLNWSSADRNAGPRVAEIGAPLSEAVDLYLDLQFMYGVPNRKGSTVSITAV